MCSRSAAISAGFWRYAQRCAGYAQWLAEGVDEDRQRAWLTGLMLRLGELLIAGAHPEAVAGIEKQPCKPGERWERERAAIRHHRARERERVCARLS